MGVRGSLGFALALVLSTSSLIEIANACDKRVFIEQLGKRLTSTIVQETSKSNPYSIKQCERACKLTSQCWAFNMAWTDAQRYIGACQLVTSSSEWQEKPGWSFFETCPFGMQYSSKNGKCYAKVVFSTGESRVTWEGGRTHCTGFHPSAHLIEIRSSADKQEFMSLTGGAGTWWLGGWRPPGGSIGDFFWNYTGERVANDHHPPIPDFITWKMNQPDDIVPGTITDPQGNNCLIVWGKDRYMFANTFCTKQKNIICELILGSGNGLK